MPESKLLYALLHALKQWKCPACGGSGRYLHRGFNEKNIFINEEVPCTKCNGTGLHPTAQAAIDLVEKG